MAAPTLQNYLELSFGASGTSKTTGTFDVLTGDVIVVASLGENTNPSPFTVTNNGAALTWANQQSGIDVSGWCGMNLHTTVMAGARTGLTVTVARTGTGTEWWGAGIFVFRGTDGVGASVKKNLNAGGGVAATADLTTLAADSAIVMIQGDFNGLTTSVTWRTINSVTPTTGNGLVKEQLQNASHYGAYLGYWDNVGTAALKTIGVSAPTGQLYSLIAVEVKGSASGTSLTVTPAAADTAWAGTTPALKADISRSPAAPDTAWAGSTPALKTDISRTPGAANVDWAGSAPALVTTGALTLTPGAANTAWAGSTPSVTADVTRTPAAADVAWSGSTPSITAEGVLTLSPGAANVDWQGSTPSLILAAEGETTLAPGAAEIVWTGSTPVVRVTPDVVPEPPSEGGGGAYEGFEDISTEEPRSLTLHPRAAVVVWAGSRPALRIVESKPFRIRLPLRRKPAPELPRIDRTVTPHAAAAVVYTGARAVVRAQSFVEVEKLDAAQARITQLDRRIAKLEREHEEEALILAALSDS